MGKGGVKVPLIGGNLVKCLKSFVHDCMYDFQKVGAWVQVRIWRCIKCEETTNYMLVDIYISSTFLSLLLL